MRIELKARRYGLVAATAAVFCFVLVGLRSRSDSDPAEEAELETISAALKTGVGSCHSCALVGAAGSLLGSRQGKAIDSSDCIYRMGLSPTDGLEKDVGSRTTVRVVDSVRFLPYLRDPDKLKQKRLSADLWFVFGRHAKDRYFYEQGMEEHHITWLDPSTVINVGSKLNNFAGRPSSRSLKGQQSSLWFLVHLTKQHKCQKFSIFGVPDPELCSREPDASLKSVYWKKNALPWCRAGDDWSLSRVNASLPLESATLLERQALRGWAEGRTVHYHLPTWPAPLL